MQVEIKMIVTVTDELGKHIATAESTDRKSIGGNPRFYFQEVFPLAQEIMERAVSGAASSMDRKRAMAAAAGRVES